MAKRGRKVISPARNHVNLMLTDEQLERMDKCAYDLRKTRTDIIRRGIDLAYDEYLKEKMTANF